MKLNSRSLVLQFLLAGLILSSFLTTVHAEEKWWDKKWGVRKQVGLDTASTGVSLGGAVENGVVLVRLHAGNFNFTAAKEDGSDLRFVSKKGEEPVVLAHQIESYDALMNEGFVWVRVPEIPDGEQTTFWLYYGNPEGGGEVAVDASATFDAETVLAYHFAERSQPARDASPAGNNAANAGSPAEGALIGTGVRFLGRNPIKVNPSPTLEFSAGADLTIQAWLKPQSAGADAVWFSRVGEGGALRLGLAEGVPYVEVAQGGNTRRSTPDGEATPLPQNRWSQVALVAGQGSMQLLVDGKPYATLNADVPELTSGLVIGAEDPESGTGRPGFIGEMDEFVLAKAARPNPAINFTAINQSGSEESLKLLVMGDDEGGGAGGSNETLEHIMLFGDIAKNMMFDGWIAVGVCVLMIAVGWSIGIGKIFLLNKLQKGNDIFFKLWKEVTRDLNLLDENKEDQMSALAKQLPRQQQKELRDSPLYHIYHAGLEEIESRLGSKAKVKMDGLSARSMQAIRASMDAGLVHENHRLNNGIVFLTIGIAGGPYVGLLGTVVGVMITFALIAKTGEVEVNSIAPGIASALLATVFGLLVAIPALFIYSYLSGRIKNVLSSMEVFIDDFVAKIAEFYPPSAEKNFIPVPSLEIPPPVHGRAPDAPVVLSDAIREEVPSSPTPRHH